MGLINKEMLVTLATNTRDEWEKPDIDFTCNAWIHSVNDFINAQPLVAPTIEMRLAIDNWFEKQVKAFCKKHDYDVTASCDCWAHYLVGLDPNKTDKDYTAHQLSQLHLKRIEWLDFLLEQAASYDEE